MKTASQVFEEIHTHFPARYTSAQKQDFISWCKGYFLEFGYDVTVRNEGGGTNLFVGDLAQSQIVLSSHYDTALKHRKSFYSTCENAWFPRIRQYFSCIKSALTCRRTYNPFNANDNTSGVATLLSVAAEKPNGVCYLLTDGEESGAYPARTFAKKNEREMQNKLFVSLDCVGKGDDFAVVYYRLYNRKYAQRLADSLRGEYGAEAVQPKGAFPTDAEHFLKAVCISCFLRDQKGHRYFTDVHTPRDNEICAQNLDDLSNALCRYARETLI